MLDARLHFLDLVTRSLSGKEAANDLARGELMDRVAHASPDEGDDTLESAVERLERKPPAAVWKHAVIGFGAVILLLMVLAAIFTEVYRELGCLNVIREPNEALEKRVMKGVDPSRKFFLLANTEGVEDREVVDWLMTAPDHPPGNPAEFEELCNAVRRYGQPLPDRFREHGMKIDPDNGLWCLMETPSTLWSSSGRILAMSGTGRLAPVRSTELEEAVAMLEKAASAPRVESYIAPRTAERLRMIAPPRDLADVVDRFSFNGRQRYSAAFGVGVMNTWVRRADELCASKDAERLGKWIALWEGMTIRTLKLPPDRSNQYVSYHLQRVAKSFKDNAGILGLAEEEARMKRLLDECDAIEKSSAAAPLDVRYRMAKFSRSHGYMDYGLMLRFVAPEEHESGVRVEHAVIDRFSAVAAAGVFGFLAFVAVLEGWRRVAQVRGMAHGLMPLLRPGDYAWLIGLGLAVPLLWQIVLMRFTPLGCRDFTIEIGDAIPLMGRVGGFLLFSLCMLLQTARWRLAKRGGFFGLRPPALWPGWVIAVVPALFLPVTGLIRYKLDLDEGYLACACAVLGVPLLWLLWRAASLVFCPRNAALAGVMLCRMVLPVLVLASIVMLGSALLLKWEEKTWVARDKISLPDPSGSGFSIIAARAEQWQRDRLLKAMQ